MKKVYTAWAIRTQSGKLARRQSIDETLLAGYMDGIENAVYRTRTAAAQDILRSPGLDGARPVRVRIRIEQLP